MRFNMTTTNTPLSAFQEISYFTVSIPHQTDTLLDQQR